jgi:hypothetical protein
MQPIGLFELLKQVLTSWQVIVVTLVILAYINIVSYVSKSYHRPRSSKKIKINIFKKRQSKAANLPGNPEEALPESNTDELGLEEA